MPHLRLSGVVTYLKLRHYMQKNAERFVVKLFLRLEWLTTVHHSENE